MRFIELDCYFGQCLRMRNFCRVCYCMQYNFEKCWKNCSTKERSKDEMKSFSSYKLTCTGDVLSIVWDKEGLVGIHSCCRGARSDFWGITSGLPPVTSIFPCQEDAVSPFILAEKLRILLQLQGCGSRVAKGQSPWQSSLGLPAHVSHTYQDKE